MLTQDQFARLKTERRWNLQYLGDIIGVSPGILRRIFAKKHPISRKAAVRMSNYLNIPWWLIHAMNPKDIEILLVYRMIIKRNIDVEEIYETKIPA